MGPSASASACINFVCPSLFLCHFPVLRALVVTFCCDCECDLFCNQLLHFLAPLYLCLYHFCVPIAPPFCAIFLYLFAMFVNVTFPVISSCAVCCLYQFRAPILYTSLQSYIHAAIRSSAHTRTQSYTPTASLQVKDRAIEKNCHYRNSNR